MGAADRTSLMIPQRLVAALRVVVLFLGLLVSVIAGLFFRG